MGTRDIARPAQGCQLAIVILAIVGSLVGLRAPATAVDQIPIVSYPLADNSDGSNGFGPGSLDNTLLADTTISAGPGLGQFSVGTDSWSGSTQVLKTGPGTAVASATASAALSRDWYFEITLTPRVAIDLRAVSADWSRGGTTATRGWFVRSSLDNYASDLYANETPVSTPTGLNSVSFPLTGFSNIATPITFRFYIYTDATGRYMDFQNIAFYRSVPPVPVLPPELPALINLPVATVPVVTVVPSTTVAPTTTVPPSATVPSPIPQDDGELPELAPGVSRVLENGAPAPVEVFVQDSTDLVLRGDGFQLTLSAECSFECTIETDLEGRQVLELEENGMAQVRGQGFLASTPVYVWLFSEPKFLGKLTVNADGTFAGSLSLAGIEVGGHTLQVNGTSVDGAPLTANLGVLVSPEGTPTPLPGVLPSTGSELDAGVMVWAPLLAGLGVALVWAGRRRTSSVQR